MTLRTLMAILLVVPAAIVAGASASREVAAKQTTLPILPVFTNFTYFDHHWIQWLPDHPVYEAIEAQIAVAPDGKDEFVRVFLTERQGAKRQVYYFNDEQTAQRWQGGSAFFRTFATEMKGPPGGPVSLSLKFKDAEEKPVAWSLDFAPGLPLRDEGAGMRPGLGHAADQVFIIHYYGRNAVASAAKLALDGATYTAKPDGAERRYYTGHTAGSYTPVIRFGTLACSGTETTMSCDQGRRLFQRVASENGIETWQSNPFGWRGLNRVRFTRKTQGPVLSLSHSFGAHRFDFALGDGTYEIALDALGPQVRGTLRMSEAAPGPVFTWEPEVPAWMKKDRLVSSVEIGGDGYSYRLTTQRAAK